MELTKLQFLFHFSHWRIVNVSYPAWGKLIQIFFKNTVKSCLLQRDVTNTEPSLILLAMHQERTREKLKKFQACQGRWHNVHTEMQPEVGHRFGSSLSPTVVPESLWRRYDRVWNWHLCWWSFAERHAWAVVNPPKTPIHHKATQQPRGKLKSLSKTSTNSTSL